MTNRDFQDLIRAAVACGLAALQSIFDDVEVNDHDRSFPELASHDGRICLRGNTLALLGTGYACDWNTEDLRRPEQDQAGKQDWSYRLLAPEKRLGSLETVAVLGLARLLGCPQEEDAAYDGEYVFDVLRQQPLTPHARCALDALEAYAGKFLEKSL